MRSYKFLPREPHRSPTQIIKDVGIKEVAFVSKDKFLPYVNERDGMGRLIKDNIIKSPRKSHVAQMPQIISMKNNHKINSSPQPHPQDHKTQHVQETIYRSFEYHETNPQTKIPQGNKIKIRKHSLQINVRKLSQDMICSQNTNRQLKQMLENNRITETTTYTEIDSPLMRKNSSVISIKPIKICEQIRESKMDQKQCKKLQQQKSNSLKCKRKLLEKIEEKKSSQKILAPLHRIRAIQSKDIFELNRYQTFKNLDIKLTTRFQEGHKKFMTKMMETKKLAYKIKMCLQST